MAAVRGAARRAASAGVVVVVVAACAMVAHASTDPCAAHTSCTGCLSTASLPGCGWCGDTGQCQSSRSSCSAEAWSNPGSQWNGTLSTSASVAPVSQRVFLRAGQPLSVSITVTPQPCQPVDMYLLMDFTASMYADLTSVQSLAQPIGQTVFNICNAGACNTDRATLTNQTCARLGFGAFKEKPTYPAGYWDASLVWLRNSTTVPNANYVFRSFIPLSTDLETFISDVASVGGIGGNYDPPEDPFGGLVQALMCRRLVGWDNYTAATQPRRIVLIITDIDFHLRVEGIRSGQFQPATAVCWANESLSDEAMAYFWLDSWSTVYDYPSLQLVKDLLIETNTIPVFSVPFDGTNQRAYNDVVNYFGFGYVVQLSTDASNVVTALQEAYDALTSQLSAGVVVSAYQSLVQSITPTSFSNVSAGQQYTFNVTLYYDGTLAPANDVPVTISLLGYASSTILVDLIVECDCSTYCLDANGAPKCGSNGACNCGGCICNDGWAGPLCNCSTDTSLCPTINGAICAGHGVCECDACVCESGFSGANCSCIVGGCPVQLSTGAACSGHGTCSCGTCVCDAGWSLFDCSCATSSNFTCVGNTCSGNGVCVTAPCPMCQCNAGYSGAYCETQNAPCPNNCNNNGLCVGGVCECDAGWSGDTCDCPTNATLCGDPPCNGQGTCSCGQCSCDVGWTGAQCDCYTLCEVIGLSMCAGHGTCDCSGQCQCDAGWLPPYCECAANATCPGSTSGNPCNGQGTCVCGECQCSPGYTGSACDCQNVGCTSDCGLLDGHGQCVCGACVCEPPYLAATNCQCNGSIPCPTSVPGSPCSGNGQCLYQINSLSGQTQCAVCQCDASGGVPLWAGDDCSCSTAPCYVDAYGNTCSGHGSCVCGQCLCAAGWQGSECNCASCAGINCGAYGVCVCGACQCVQGSGYYGSLCQYCDETVSGNLCPPDPCRNMSDCSSCAGAAYGCGWCSSGGGCFNISTVGQYCSPYLSDSSSCPFLGSLTKNQTIAVFSGTFAGLIALAILVLLLVKAVHTVQDRREWVRFEREKERSRWKADQNPLFKSQTTEFVNPLYVAPPGLSASGVRV